jgi:hypothetical protein
MDISAGLMLNEDTILLKIVGCHPEGVSKEDMPALRRAALDRNLRDQINNEVVAYKRSKCWRRC